MQRIRGRKADSWPGPARTEIEGVALEQLKNISSLPGLPPCAAMPDATSAKAATVGSVIAMKGAVSRRCRCRHWFAESARCDQPERRRSPDDLRAWRWRLGRAIPVGSTSIGGAVDRAAGQDAVGGVQGPHSRRERSAVEGAQQLGTLGGGNHFSELCLDTDQRVWMMLHSGSRTSQTLAEIHIQRAKKLGAQSGPARSGLGCLSRPAPGDGRVPARPLWARGTR